MEDTLFIRINRSYSLNRTYLMIYEKIVPFMQKRLKKVMQIEFVDRMSGKKSHQLTYTTTKHVFLCVK